jgi:hypothetical protein
MFWHRKTAAISLENLDARLTVVEAELRALRSRPVSSKVAAAVEPGGKLEAALASLGRTIARESNKRTTSETV